ncbi:MAG: ribosomal protein S18-alanine N-acetyltransferase [Eubacterium sp.]|nr:ribosomal protein S18-alanine N-acetyltransferase [Eubacterium sp.]
MSLRLMTPEDAQAVYAVSQACGLGSWSLDSYTREAVNPVAKYLVAEAEDKIAGFAGIWCVVDEAQVMNVGVLPEYRGQGLGKRLMEGLWQQAADAGCSLMTLEVKADNTAALALYRGQGFEVTGVRKDYYPGPVDGLMMERRRHE